MFLYIDFYKSAPHPPKKGLKWTVGLFVTGNDTVRLPCQAVD